MTGVEPDQFYTGLVAELYAPLRLSEPDPEPYARFIERTGQPAVELGCGDGDPLIALRRAGLAVEGVDSSVDMLDRCRRRAASAGVDVTLHHSTFQEMDLGRRFPAIFFAGATFNLLPDDETAGRALERIREHLAPGGTALIPLFIPEAVGDHGRGRRTELTDDSGTTLRCSTLSVDRDEVRRLQVLVLRYEREEANGAVTSLDRPWVLHWHSQEGFRALAEAAGLRTRGVVTPSGAAAGPHDSAFSFLLQHA